MSNKNKTNLYKEAVIEARELRAVAEKQVKQQLLEELSPIIKRTLDKQFLSLTSLNEELVVEEFGQDPAAVGPEDPSAKDTSTTLPVAPEKSGIEVTDTAETVEVAPPTGATAAPITPVDDNNAVNIPLPGVDGTITVSVEDLFTRPSEVVKAVDQVIATPAPEEIADAKPEEEVPPLDAPLGNSDVGTVGSQLDATGDLPLTENVSKRTKFLNLVEFVASQATAKETITEKVAEKIQFSLIALQEESEDLLLNGIIEARDYQLCKKRAEKIQKSLQEKLNSQFQQNSYIQHNQKTDGESMAIKQSFKELFEETEVVFDTLDTDKAQKELEAEEKKLAGQDPGVQDIGQKSTKGDWSEEGATAAASDSEAKKTALEEAIAAFKLALISEEDEGSVVDSASDFGGSSEPAADDAATDGDFDIEALLQSFEQQLEDHGIDLSSLNVDIAGEEDGKEIDLGFALDDEGQVAAVDGAEGGSDEGGEAALVIAEASKAIKKARSVIAEARAEKAEADLYSFKTVCLNKLLMREALQTKSDKQEAILALDGGATIKEVETIFNRIIANKIQEGKVAKNSKAAAGVEKSMISEGVKSGTANLNEGMDPTIARLQQLAGIKK